MFNLDDMALKVDELNVEKTQFLIEDFLVKEAITMIYGAASQGKTWFMYALSRFLAECNDIQKIYYIDMDNGKRQLKDRGVDKNLLVYEKVKYINKGSLKISINDLLISLVKSAYGDNYKDVVFVFDSTRDFVDVRNDKAARAFMEQMKAIREAGATILLIHHASKSGRVIEGSAEFVRSADNVYELKQKKAINGQILYSLKVENDRDPIKDKQFNVYLDTFKLKEGENDFANLTQEQEEFVKNVLTHISLEPLNQSAIFKQIGKKRDDKTARKMLDMFVGRFWKFKIDGKAKIYYPIGADK